MTADVAAGVAALRGLTLGEAIDRYDRGHLSQQWYEAYRHVWAETHPGASDAAGWMGEPHADVAPLVAALRDAVGAR